MKNFKKVVFGLLSALLVTFVIVSCSDDANETMIQNQTVLHSTGAKQRGVKLSVQELLENNYQNYKIQKNIRINDEAGMFNLIGVEVNIPNTNVYLIENLDKGEVEVIAELNSETKIIEIYDLINSEMIKVFDIDKEDVLKQNNYDLIKTTEQIVANGIVIGNSKRFWGWTCGNSYSIEPGSCYQNCTYNVLFSKVSKTDVYPCNKFPNAGKDPKLDPPHISRS